MMRVYSSVLSRRRMRQSLHSNIVTVQGNLDGNNLLSNVGPLYVTNGKQWKAGLKF
jgi:hypothetical protein